MSGASRDRIGVAGFFSRESVYTGRGNAAGEGRIFSRDGRATSCTLRVRSTPYTLRAEPSAPALMACAKAARVASRPGNFFFA